MPKRMVYDRWLFFTVGILVVCGLFMVGSSSHYLAMSKVDNPYAFLFKHALHLLVGLVAFVVALRMPYTRLMDRWLVLSLIAACGVLLIVVLAMPAVGGAHRWIVFGPLRFQPSELAKLAVVIFVAGMLARKEERVNDAWAVPIPCLVVVGGLALLVAIEPDLGSAVMLAVVAAVMLFAAGLRWRHVGLVAGLGAIAFVVAVIAEPYRLQRIKTFLDPNVDTQGAAHQLTQSLIAVGSGGLTGVGPGQGQQKAFFLPAAHTDFIYSVVGEEFGLIGTGLLLAGFLLLYWRGMRAALRSPDRFGFYLALGITNLLVLQALINMGVCLGLLPTKGIPLPFISYGGSSLVMSLAAMGLLLNVSQYSN